VINCPEDEVLQEFADGELERGEAGCVEQHLAACPRCRLAVAHYRAIVAAARVMPEPECPAGLTGWVLARVSAGPVRRRLGVGVLAASVLAAVVAAGILLGPDGGPVQGPPEILVADEPTHAIRKATEGLTGVVADSREVALAVARESVQAVEGVTSRLALAVIDTGALLAEEIPAELASAILRTGSLLGEDIAANLADAIQRTGSLLDTEHLRAFWDMLDSQRERTGDDAIRKTSTGGRGFAA